MWTSYGLFIPNRNLEVIENNQRENLFCGNTKQKNDKTKHLIFKDFMKTPASEEGTDISAKKSNFNEAKTSLETYSPFLLLKMINSDLSNTYLPISNKLDGYFLWDTLK